MQGLHCVCTRMAVPSITPGTKRKRSGLVTRTMPVEIAQTSQSKGSPAKVLFGSVRKSPSQFVDVLDDDSYQMKQQRMASLDKIPFEADTSSSPANLDGSTFKVDLILNRLEVTFFECV